MEIVNEEPPSDGKPIQVMDLVTAVKQLHSLNSQELSRLLRETENLTIPCQNDKGSTINVDAEKLATFLPLHLIAKLIISDRDEGLFAYLLHGFRLLHTLCDVAPRHYKLEQVLLDDVKISEQMLDLVFYSLLSLAQYRQEYLVSSHMLLWHSALVPCCLNLLTACISPHFQELALVLLAHPKADIFMMGAFGSVHAITLMLQIQLSAQCNDYYKIQCLTDEHVVNFICQQCEASLQYLHSLCLQKNFRDRLLRNKELCGKGGVLYLAQSILKLNIMPPYDDLSLIVASVSRLKAKVLSILLQLCEADSISYLDEVASSPVTLDLAKSIALEVLNLLKTGLIKDPKHLDSGPSRSYPMGLLQLNALRLADIFSDDSNFRSFIIDNFTEFLSTTFSLPHEDFLVTWCSSDYPTREADATLEYDAFVTVGWVLDAASSSNASNATTKVEFSFIQNGMRQATYAHQRSAQFVKIIANLHCFVPSICEEQERNFFLKKFLGCLHMDPSKVLPGFSFVSGAQKAATVCRNLRSLVSHADSLIPISLNEDDVHLLRIFFQQLEPLVNPAEFEESRVQEGQSTGGCVSPSQRNEPPNPASGNGNNPREEMSETSAYQEDEVTRQSRKDGKGQPGVFGGSREIEKDVPNVTSNATDTSGSRGRNTGDQRMEKDGSLNPNENIEDSGARGGAQEEEKVETAAGEEKQQRKRKRTIMNDNQILMMEKALLDEPDMQRNTESIRSWAEKLSLHGSEVTPSQLRNWLNNRKARLARASKSEAEKHRQLRESSDSPSEDRVPSNTRANRTSLRSTTTNDNANPELVDTSSAEAAAKFKLYQHVMLVGAQGEEIAKAKVHQVAGKWYGNNLEESQTCIVDVIEMKGERWTRLPYPSEATGSTFGEAEAKLGVMRVMWDSGKMGLPAQ